MDNVAKLQVGPERTNKEISNKFIRILEEKPEIVVNEMAGILKMSIGGVRYHINKMKKDGMIEHIGSKKRENGLCIGK